MDNALFEELLASVAEMKEIERGERAPAREFGTRPEDVQAIRAKTGLSQDNFAMVIGVKVSTLRSWEQGQRVPAGPARMLLRALSRKPREVVEAIGIVELPPAPKRYVRTASKSTPMRVQEPRAAYRAKRKAR